MNNQDMKIYFDGSHYIGIPKGAFPSKKGRKRRVVKPMHQTQKEQTVETPPETTKERFAKAYKESQSLPKRERKAHIKQKLKDSFDSKEELNAYVDENVERAKTNAIKRKVRLMRKLRLQDWDYFCTFTYSDELHTEESFRKKLSNTLKHLVARNGWKYIGVWERGNETNRLHFHGIFHIPKMIGELEKVKDYDTRNHRMQTTYQNTHFLKHFGRNDFKDIATQDDVADAAKYITKYLEKSGERLVYGGKLPTYFLSDVLDEDVACPYGVDDRKVLLFDNFTCMNEGEILGKVSKEVIEQLPKSN